MSPLSNASPTISAPVLRARLALRGPGDANHSRTLDGECTRDAPFQPRADRRAQTVDVCRFKTEPGEPLWNGPRLRPAFVAQVLGQVMMAPSVPTARAYDNAIAQIAPGAFFDAGA